MNTQERKEILKQYPRLRMNSLVPESKDEHTYYGNFMTDYAITFHDKLYYLTYIMQVVKTEKGFSYNMHDVVWRREIMWHEDDFVFNGINYRIEPVDHSLPEHQDLYQSLHKIYTNNESFAYIAALLNLLDKH